MTQVDLQAYCRCGHRAWQHQRMPRPYPFGWGPCETCRPHAGCGTFVPLEDLPDAPRSRRAALAVLVLAIIGSGGAGLYLAHTVAGPPGAWQAGVLILVALGSLAFWWIMAQTYE